jgi:hypothetical protein
MEEREALVVEKIIGERKLTEKKCRNINVATLLYCGRERERVTLRLAVYRHSVRLGGKPLETHD